MSAINDIQLLNLIIGFLALLIPVFCFLYFKVRIVGDLAISALRMCVQLMLVALYLEWIFELNSPWINSVWVFIMIVVGVMATIRRVKLNWKIFLVPFFISGLTSILIIDTFFLGLIIRLDYFFDARYFIPITGMVLGNSMNHNIVGLSAYFSGVKEKSDLYYFLLTNTNNRKLALMPFISGAIIKGLNPMMAMMSVVGLISLPGMMTGQILGGSPPIVAIKYQVMIMIAIFTGCTINLVLSIILSNQFIFDKYGRLKKSAFKRI